MRRFENFRGQYSSITPPASPNLTVEAGAGQGAMLGVGVSSSRGPGDSVRGVRRQQHQRFYVNDAPLPLSSSAGGT